jgi:hypothetical protein
MFSYPKVGNEDMVVAPLARSKRTFLFVTLFLIFVIAVPLFVFHAIGYRYDFFSTDRGIISTGALYVTVPHATAQIYLNDERVRDARVFRRASYIQHVAPGLQRIHVSDPGLHTWVKELPVYPYMVTEAEAFLLPVRPQLRLITEYIGIESDVPLVTEEQFAFLSDTASTTMVSEVMVFATSSSVVRGTTSRAIATTTLPLNAKINPEYTVVTEKFAHGSTISTASVLEQAIANDQPVFQFQTRSLATSTPAEESATTTKIRGALTLFTRANEIVVLYTGNTRDIPYYFCVPNINLASTTEVYGAHVMRGLEPVLAATGDAVITETGNSNRVCRSEIPIDTQGAVVYSFDFVSVGIEAVITHRSDGIFVTEIDDRSWQNTQKIYGDTAAAMVIDGNRVFVKDEKGFYAELLLTLIAPNK